jgi:hypothetical protein
MSPGAQPQGGKHEGEIQGLETPFTQTNTRNMLPSFKHLFELFSTPRRVFGNVSDPRNTASISANADLDYMS